jgi:hypothetical protein
MNNSKTTQRYREDLEYELAAVEPSAKMFRDAEVAALFTGL